MNFSSKSPQLSIIIPVHNGAWSIRRCLDALLRESLSVSLEIIVVDDGSVDTTPDILDEFQDKVRVIRQENAGPGAARNTGVAHASADLVVFMDSDDEVVQGRLLMQLDFMRQHPEIILSFGAIIFRSQPSVSYLSTLEVKEYWSILQDPYRHLMTCGGECVNTASVMLRKEHFDKVGGFDTRFRCGEDTDLWVRLAELGPFAYHGSPMTVANDTRCEAKLTQSAYVYTDGPRALIEILKRDTRLAPSDRAVAETLVKKSAEMMLRYDWTNRSRTQMLSDIALCSPVFGKNFERKWTLISYLPPQLGKILRWAKTRLKGTTGRSQN